MLGGRLPHSQTVRYFAAGALMAALSACGSEPAPPAQLGQLRAEQSAATALPPAIMLSFDLDGERFRLELQRSAIPVTENYQTLTQRLDGSLVPSATRLSGCLYRGRVEPLSGATTETRGGWAIVDACRGPANLPAGAAVSGIVQANGRFWQLQPSLQPSDIEAAIPHVLSRLYRLDTLDVVHAEPQTTSLRVEPESFAPRLEFQEGTDAETKYIDLIVVSDAARVARLGGATESETVQFVAAMNALLEESGLVPRLRVTLRAQVLFEADPYAPAFQDGEVDHDSLLGEFLDWASSEEALPAHDEHILLSGLDFLGATAGYAGLGVACAQGANGFIVQAEGLGAGFPILSAVHELGHTLGMDHDSAGNACPQQGFIMAAVGCGNCSIDGAQFSSCSRDAFATYLGGPRYAEGGLCADDVPLAPGVAACGDGVVSAGEACDCGSADCSDIDPCCDGSSCQLLAGAECSDYGDACCEACRIVTEPDVVCRSQRSSCDIAETCNGVSKECPADSFLPAGDECEDDLGNLGACYFGECRSRGVQCALIAEQQVQLGQTQFENIGAPGPTCNDACNQVVCGLNTGGCITINGPSVVDGVPCGEGQCVRGQCVELVDQCPDNPQKAEPGACGCAVLDEDGDGDDVADCVDGCPTDGAKLAPGECGCNSPDVDTDADGALDCNDSCPDDPGKLLPGTCGCGQADADSDGDGTPDCDDECPDDPARSVPGACGCNAPATDGDGDGTPDCDDGCPDDPSRAAPPCGAESPNPATSSDAPGGNTRAFGASASGGCSLPGAVGQVTSGGGASGSRAQPGAALAWLMLMGLPWWRRRRHRARRPSAARPAEL